MQDRDQGAAAREPDRGLRRRVAAADHPDPLRCAELALERAGRVEDAHALVALEPLHGQPPVVGAGREQDRTGGDLVAFLQLDDVPLLARLERLRAVGTGGPGAELPRLRDRAAGQLGAGDAGGKAEIVLDPPRRARLPAERGALDEERVESLGGAVHRRAQAGRPTADDQQVHLLARRELEADPQRPRELAIARVLQLRAAREPHQRQL